MSIISKKKIKIHDRSLLPLICIFWPKPIGSIFKTLLLLTIPAQPYFWPKSANNDVPLTSFTANLSGPLKFPLILMCKIDRGRIMESLVAIHALGFELSKDKRRRRGRGRFAPPGDAQVNPREAGGGTLPIPGFLDN